MTGQAPGAPVLTGRPAGTARLMAGWRETSPAGLSEHLDRYGPLPLRGRGGRQAARGLADAVADAGLTGRGGGGFPTGTKMHAVAARGGTAVVVANGMESEPASSKDEALLSLAPHLALDGAVLAAEAVGARVVHLCMSRLRPGLIDRVLAAVACREQARMDPVPIQVHALPDHYVSGEESALIRWLNGGEAKPVQAPPLPYERGVRRLPTLVDNVETLAHIALIARYGPAWFRQAGRPDATGTMLVTISGAVDYPGVREIELGTGVGEVLARSGVARSAEAVLVGGYFGSWHDARGIAAAPMSGKELSRLGASPGAGVLVPSRLPPAGSPKRPVYLPTSPRRAPGNADRACSGLPRSPGTSPSSRQAGPVTRCSSGWDAGWRSSPDAAHAVTRMARSGWLPPLSARSPPTSARTRGTSPARRPAVIAACCRSPARARKRAGGDHAAAARPDRLCRAWPVRGPAARAHRAGRMGIPDAAGRYRAGRPAPACAPGAGQLPDAGAPAAQGPATMSQQQAAGTMTARHRRRRGGTGDVAGRAGGAEGNERLTAMTGAVLLVLFAAEGITIAAVHKLLTLHFFIGMLLAGPVLLKIGSTGYRFARYYTGAPPYVRKGPPAPLLRLLGPVVVLTSCGVIGSGVALAFAARATAHGWSRTRRCSCSGSAP